MTSDTKVTVSRTINAPAAEIFNVLGNPDKHVELDGSGFIRSAEKAQRIQAVGDVFRMNMDGPHMGGEYQMDNHISGFSANHLIAWKSAPAGTEPPGWEWVYELAAEGSQATQVTLTYDWSNVTDKDLLAKIKFPLVSESELEDSLARLDAAVTS